MRYWEIDTRVMRDLGTLGGTNSHANGINNDGKIVGRSEDDAGHEHAFLYDPVQGLIDLHSRISLGGDNSTALAINNAGVIVGGSEDEDGTLHAIRYDCASNELTDLGFLRFGDSSLAFGINDFDDIVGNGTVVHEVESRAFFTDGAAVGVATLIDIGNIGRAEVKLQGISNARVGFGFGETAPGIFRALAYYPNRRGPVDLGTLGGPNSAAYGANAQGTIVGQSETTGRLPHGFIYEPSRGMRDLNGNLPSGPRQPLRRRSCRRLQ